MAHCAVIFAIAQLSCIKTYYVLATFTPRSSHISNARFTHSLLLASSLAAGRRSAPRDRYDRHLLLFVHSLLNRCYILVSGSVRVRVRVRARVSARVAVKDRDRN